VRFDGINVVFTTPDETLAAVRVAAALAEPAHAPVTVIHFCTVPYPLAVDAPVGVSPAESESFLNRVRAEGVDVRIRVYLCRPGRTVMPTAFKPHSIIVLGGHRSWWPTASERLRRRLEGAGHYVVFVEPAVAGDALR